MANGQILSYAIHPRLSIGTVKSNERLPPPPEVQIFLLEASVMR